MQLRKTITILLITLITVLFIGAVICFSEKFAFPGDSAEEKITSNSFVSQKSYATILFVGDIMFDRGIRYYAAKNGGNSFVFEKIKPLFLENDLVIANLEGPLTDHKSVSSGTGVGNPNNFVFTFDPSWAKTLFEENIRMVDLGNNHISNFGREGVASTKKYLSQAHVGYFGTPDGPRSAQQTINGIKISFVSYNEFSMQKDEKQAAIDEIRKVKKDSDVVVVMCHWGVEYVLTPTDTQRELARQFIDEGADLIIGGHPHVVESIEEYKGKKIYYSLGNFVFDQYGFKNCQDGLGVQVKIDKTSKQMDFKKINFYLQPNGQTIEKTK